MASIAWIPAIFALATFYLYWLSTHLPDLTGNNKNFSLKFPSTLDDLQELSSVLGEYKVEHYNLVFLLFFSAYLYKQTFAIPGSVFLNLLAGALFGVWKGFPICCFLTALGATCCYLLSKYCGKAHIERHFTEKLKILQCRIEENSDSLIFFLLFVRLFPMSPNWMLNIASPILNIPVHLFFISVFIGLMPYNYICVQTGSMLSEITSVNDIFTTTRMIQLICIAMVALVPGYIIRKYHRSKEDLGTLNSDNIGPLEKSLRNGVVKTE
ncbi:unnamed protein product [Owenia fusiformis]|uniref:Uncharacterized protein n=1 Tax=Owenia fusiformis TaxID=6347 RepID=A0A8J1TTE5_OWEFU|nr:unnamed protein product [Owenia fusiformis]